jgi:hypothetical protein
VTLTAGAAPSQYEHMVEAMRDRNERGTWRPYAGPAPSTSMGMTTDLRVRWTPDDDWNASTELGPWRRVADFRLRRSDWEQLRRWRLRDDVVRRLEQAPQLRPTTGYYVRVAALRRIAEILSPSLTDRGIGQWLQARNRVLDGRTPIDLVIGGDVRRAFDAAESFAEGDYI